MKVTIAAAPVWCENCSISFHNIEIKTTTVDIAASIICESCNAVLYLEPPASIDKYNENTLAIICSSISTGRMYSGYCDTALTLKTNPVYEKAFYDMRDLLGEKIRAYFEKQTSETLRKPVLK